MVHLPQNGIPLVWTHCQMENGGCSVEIDLAPPSSRGNVFGVGFRGVSVTGSDSKDRLSALETRHFARLSVGSSLSGFQQICVSKNMESNLLVSSVLCAQMIAIKICNRNPLTFPPAVQGRPCKGIGAQMSIVHKLFYLRKELSFW